MEIHVRQYTTLLEETLAEEGRDVGSPKRRAWAAATIRNPYAGLFTDSFAELEAASDLLAVDLVRRCVSALDQDAESYGKAALVGTDGALEAAHACLHPRFGIAVRRELGRGRSMMPSTVKRGSAGTTIDVPLHHIEAALVRSHFDTLHVAVPDGPHPDEIVVILAVAVGGRPHPRIGGLSVSEISLGDGLR